MWQKKFAVKCLTSDVRQLSREIQAVRGLDMRFDTRRLANEADAIAPDGSEVRVLCQGTRGGMAVFSLPSQAVSKAVAHHSVEEVWYVISGRGRMWRKLGE